MATERAESIHCTVRAILPFNSIPFIESENTMKRTDILQPIQREWIRGARTDATGRRAAYAKDIVARVPSTANSTQRASEHCVVHVSFATVDDVAVVIDVILRPLRRRIPSAV